MFATKKSLTVQDIDSQSVQVLPNREMLALVNVTIFDVLSHNRTVVQLPIAVAANVCGVDVGVLQAQIDAGQTASCTAVAGSRAHK